MELPEHRRGRGMLQGVTHPSKGWRLAIAAFRAPLDSFPLVLAGVVTLALGIPMLLFPLGPDQAIFAYIAHRISIGGFPYITAWDQKPPAIYLLYVVALRFPGPLMRNVRLFDLFMLGLTLVAIYVLGRHLWGRWAGGLAALLYGIAYTTEYGYWHTAQPDGYTALPLCLGTWLYYRSLRGKRPFPFLLAGMLAGFAFQLRFFSALMALGLLWIEWDHPREGADHPWHSAGLRIAWFSLGFLATQALFAAYLLAGHALGAYLFTEFRFATGYSHLGGEYSPDGFRWNLYIDAARGNTLEFLYSHMFISLPAAVALLRAIREGGDRRTREVGMLAVSSYVGVLVQAKFFFYHWLAVLPFLALLGGKGLSGMTEEIFRRRSRAVAVLSLAAALGALVFLTPPITDSALHQWRGVVAYYSGNARRQRFNNEFGPYAGGTYSYLADDQVGRYLQSHTLSGDTIYIYGYEALIYLISGRESASRFFYVFPVISTWSPSAWRTELVHDLYERKPRYILIQANEGAPWITGLHEDTAHYAEHDADLQQLLAARYVAEVKIEDFSLYRLRE